MKIIGAVQIAPGETRTLCRKLLLTDCVNPAELRLKLETVPWLPPGNLENFRRGCNAVRLAQLAALLAIADTDGTVETDALAVLGWNGSGCATENQRYWQDYVEHGREFSRSTLFVPTLTTTPVSEAAITIGAHGSVGYSFDGGTVKQLFMDLAARFATGDTQQIMVLEIVGNEATAVIFQNDGTLNDGDTNNLNELFNRNTSLFGWGQGYDSRGGTTRLCSIDPVPKERVRPYV